MRRIIAVWIVFLMLMGAVVGAVAESSENKNPGEKENTELKDSFAPEQKSQHDLLVNRKIPDRDRYQSWYEHPEDRFLDEPYLHHGEKFVFRDEPYPYHPEKYQEQKEFTPAPAPKDLPKYPSHAPIYINGNAQFTSANGVSAGNGTAYNPYIIENWDINASRASTAGIDIRNTNAHFIIRNCIIHDGKNNNKYGIYFYNVQNGKIDNVTSYNNYYGIYLDWSSNNQITNCDVYNNYGGICLSSSSNNNTITNCAVYNNYDDGIYLYSSSNNNTITNCNVYNNSWDGILLSSSSNNNTITNCAVYNNWAGIRLYSSSNNNAVTNCAVYNNSYHGIGLGSSSNNQITNCTVYNNYYEGIYLDSSSNNNITNCAVYNNYYGIRLSYSSNNILRDNVLENNTYNFGVFGMDISNYYQDIDTSNIINGKPIYYITEQNGLVFNETMSIGYLGLISSSNILVENCTFTDNIQGLLLANTSYSIITNCAVYNNYDDGIYLYSSSNNQITNCAVYNNSGYYGGIYITVHK